MFRPLPMAITQSGSLLAGEVLRVLRPFGHELSLAGHLHRAFRFELEVEGAVRRFHNTAAVWRSGANFLGELAAPSGVSVYRVTGGRIDNGEFIRLDAGPESP